jgi:fatty acid desaturase
MRAATENTGDAAIPARLNLAIVGALVAVSVIQFVGVPLLLPRSPWWGALLAAPVAATIPLWSMIHEAIHGVLHPDRAWNDRIGRTLAGCFGAPLQLLRFGHLAHHRLNRSEFNRVEVAPAPAGAVGRARYYGRLLGGLYLGEVAASALALLPRRFAGALVRLMTDGEGGGLADAARRQLLERPGCARMRLDGGLIVAGWATGFWLYGAHGWMLAGAIAARAAIVSLHDNAYHYGAPLDDRMAGHDLRLPRAAQAFFLNFNLHATHHRRPDLPWTALPAAFVALGRRHEGPFLPAVLRQFAGPIDESALRAPPARDHTRTASAAARPEAWASAASGPSSQSPAATRPPGATRQGSPTGRDTRA